ncbi:MAG: type II toxin-antitoxin system RelE/ParE family toxin [Rhodobiaceae bacterium]|nr:type II toxin-antitoxin system RelE/ParE family toxin [Rhodobiaceae bacterium]MCC0055897.1 type II toxin-antitoxin system RelE/ParE family toxin [Rhodobiaceae bacterium]
MTTITYSRDAAKSLRRMPRNRAEQITAKIQQYADDPESLAANVIYLQGRNGYRLRVGDWRVLFDRIERETETEIAIRDILPRNEATYR